MWEKVKTVLNGDFAHMALSSVRITKHDVVKLGKRQVSRVNLFYGCSNFCHKLKTQDSNLIHYSGIYSSIV